MVDEFHTWASFVASPASWVESEELCSRAASAPQRWTEAMPATDSSAGHGPGRRASSWPLQHHTHLCFVRGDLSELSSIQLAVFIPFFSCSGCFWSPFSQSTEPAFSQKSLNPIIFKMTAWDLCSNQAQLAAWMRRCDLSLCQAPPSFTEPHAQLRPWAQPLMDVRKTQRWNLRSLTYTLFTALKLFGSIESIIDSWIMKNITQYSHYIDSKIRIMQFNGRVKYSFMGW